VSYNVKDWDGAKKFYGQTLGLPVALAADEFGWVEYGDQDQTHLAISRWDGNGELPRGGGGIAVLSVDDAYAAVNELRRKGVKCDDVMPVPGMVTYASFYDPEGNLLQLAGPPPKA
jgi:catechol 2,3-dioxygenase-like lactoylglutathione lyase family enzyme